MHNCSLITIKESSGLDQEFEMLKSAARAEKPQSPYFWPALLNRHWSKVPFKRIMETFEASTDDDDDL